MENILDKFLRYISVDTQSDPESNSQPSTNKQLNLLNLINEELHALGIESSVDEYGCLMASIPSNIEKEIPAIGFIAHVDTSPDASGKDIKAQITSNYDGGDILLNKEKNLYLRVSDFPEMAQYKGQTIITTDGNTLLGADDKAGIAEIMYAVQYLCEHPEIKHGEIKIGFTPDEEIGRGVVKFDVAKFGAKYAYTLDGGEISALSINGDFFGKKEITELASLLIGARFEREELQLVLSSADVGEYISGATCDDLVMLLLQ